jgi:hypothetical protein
LVRDRPMCSYLPSVPSGRMGKLGIAVQDGQSARSALLVCGR